VNARERYERASAIFLEICDLPLDARAEALATRCADDAALRAEVESLLSHDGARDTPPRVADADLEAAQRTIADHDGAPERIGRYRIVSLLGEGGMGRVYLAEQESPRREVAVKALRALVSTDTMRRRMEFEAFLLGRLRHPNIAQVYEAGVAESDGCITPFIAMELVRGRTITQEATARALAPVERIELFLPVCQAVHHAHTVGVVHRDLKPGNILVDQAGAPKVLDFGVARATAPDLRSETLATSPGQLVGTLAYMSPEQSGADPDGVDARSDVYALGLVLYELLTGRPALDAAGLGLEETLRRVREVDPPAPGSIDRALRGDISAVVMRAIEKSPERRYQSAAELAADLRRVLRNEPVEARPLTAWYALRKFASRRPGAVGAAGALLLVAVIGAGATGFQAWRATQAEREALDLAAAEQVQREAAEEALADAERQRLVTERVNEFLNRVLAQADPTINPQGRDTTIPEALDLAADPESLSFPDDPAVEGAIRQTLGWAYYNLGDYERADEQLTRAYDLRTGALGAEHRETMQTLNALALLDLAVGRMDGAMERLEILRDFDEGATDTERRDRLGTTLNNIGLIGLYTGRFALAEESLARAIDIKRDIHGADSFELALLLNNRAGALGNLGRAEEGIPVAQEALRLRRARHGDTHPEVAQSLNVLGWLHQRAEDWNGAAPYMREAYTMRRAMLGDDHPDTARAAHNLALTEWRRGDMDAPGPLFEEARTIWMTTFPPDHRDVVAVHRNYGQFLEARDGPAAAMALHLRWFEALDAVEAPSERIVRQQADALLHAGQAANRAERFEEAETALRRALDRYDALGQPGANAEFARISLGEAALRLGRADEAADLIVPAFDRLAAALPADDEDLAFARERLRMLDEPGG
jgi:tetratricopeptide (TPR) repeat protein